MYMFLSDNSYLTIHKVLKKVTMIKLNIRVVELLLAINIKQENNAYRYRQCVSSRALSSHWWLKIDDDGDGDNVASQLASRVSSNAKVCDGIRDQRGHFASGGPYGHHPRK